MPLPTAVLTSARFSETSDWACASCVTSIWVDRVPMRAPDRAVAASTLVSDTVGCVKSVPPLMSWVSAVEKIADRGRSLPDSGNLRGVEIFLGLERGVFWRTRGSR